MHSAPSVSYPVVRSSRAGALLAGCWALSAGAVLAWCFVSPAATDARHAAALVSLAVAGLAAWHGWRTQPAGAVAWDGADWQWTGAGTQALTGRIDLSLDFQGAMLLRLAGGRGGRWFWAERATAPAVWDDLRRAVHARTLS